jgi:hypothetical protein
MLKTLALSALFGLVVIGQAQAAPAPIATIQQCELESPGAIFQMVQDKYGEVPMLQGKTMVQSVRGPYLNANLYMFMNPETRTYSIILVDPNTGMECLWLAGGELAPIYSGEQGEPM